MSTGKAVHRVTEGVRAQQLAETRRRLVTEARALFADRGYAAVGLAEVVAAAQVTKGALYHQFDSKTDLFRSVLEQVQAEVAQQVSDAAQATADPWEQLVAGCRAFLQASTGPQTQRIMLVDGPAVLGWSEWRAMDEATSAAHLGDALDTLIARGVIRPQPVRPLTHLLSGAMNEAALWLASSSDPRDFDDAWSALSAMLMALRDD